MPLLATIACTPPPPPRVGCGQFTVQAVAQSAAGEVFIAGQTNAYGIKVPDHLLTKGGPFVAAVGAAGTVDWIQLLPYDDESPLMLDPRADAGPVVIGGGAAATHYDAAGNVALTIGYLGMTTPYASVTTPVAVTSDDRIVVASSTSVRAFGGAGGEQWVLPLPANVIQVTLLVADRAGGVWLGGTFVGTGIPADPNAAGAGGYFLMHLDRDGAQVGIGVWQPATPNDGLTFSNAVVSADPAATGSLVVAAAYQGRLLPDLMLPAPNGSAGYMAMALDAAGAVVWVHQLTAPPFLVPEASGTFLALTPQYSAPPDAHQIGVVAARWDANGQEITSTTAALPSLHTDWIARPGAGGDDAIVVGETGGTCQTTRHSLFQIGGADLQLQELPFKLDQGTAAPTQPGGGP